MEGGVVNHGYVGDVHPSKSNNNRAARLPSSSDSTSGYYSTGRKLLMLSIMSTINKISKRL